MKDYSSEYGLSPVHSEVLAASALMQPGHAWDVGCGNGRNSLYLAAQGWRVQALDVNPSSIAKLNEIAQKENLTNLHASVVDLNQEIPKAPERYDWVLSTVVMMFLQPQTIAPLIGAMQEATKPGGYNLVVAAMNTEQFPAPADFPFAFSKDELKNYYAGWRVQKYNENEGQLHRVDAQGNRIRLNFATLLAQKPGV